MAYHVAVWTPTRRREPPPLVAVVGPTATGKSDLGLALAAELGGEVVNADAMQLYRGLDIGTAKLTPRPSGPASRTTCSTCWTSPRPPSVAAYQRAARAAVERLRAAGRTPVLVGGSGLYVQAVLDELEFPGTDPALRAGWRPSWPSAGPPRCTPGSPRLDPAAAAAVLPSNGRRIVRALEVIALTGRPFPARLPTPGAPRYDAVLIGIDRDTAELDVRIARRVARMFAAGLVDETRGCSPAACARAGPPRGRWATSRSSPPWTARGSSPTPRPTRCGRPGASSAGSGPGSAATAGSTGSTAAPTTCSTAASGARCAALR